jgi:hypothetical protein
LKLEYLHPSTAVKLQNAIDNKSFQPASLFCLFETGRLAQSFQMADATGNPVTDQAAVDSFIVQITRRFAPTTPGLRDATSALGLPTPDNPFVLGYGISQVDLIPLPSTPQFDPQNFQFSVTHQPDGFGTINFLMLLGPITQRSNVTQNLQAGVFATSFLANVGADAPGPTGGPQYDGTLAISALSFQKQYIIKQLQPLFAIPNPSISGRTISTDSNITTWTPGSFADYKIDNVWSSSTSGDDDDRTQYNGTWTMSVGITSNYAGQRMDITTPRNLTINATGSYWIRFLETVSACECS